MLELDQTEIALSITEGWETGLADVEAKTEKVCRPRWHWTCFQVITVDLTKIFYKREGEKSYGECEWGQSTKQVQWKMSPYLVMKEDRVTFVDGSCFSCGCILPDMRNKYKHSIRAVQLSENNAHSLTNQHTTFTAPMYTIGSLVVQNISCTRILTEKLWCSQVHWHTHTHTHTHSHTHTQTHALIASPQSTEWVGDEAALLLCSTVIRTLQLGLVFLKMPGSYLSLRSAHI